jgi:hypothetical protein
VGAIFLLVTTEIIYPYFGQAKLAINIKKLKNLSKNIGILFLVTTAVIIAEKIISAIAS